MLPVNSPAHNICMETSAVSHSHVPHSSVLGGRLNHHWVMYTFTYVRNNLSNTIRLLIVVCDLESIVGTIHTRSCNKVIKHVNKLYSRYGEAVAAANT